MRILTVVFVLWICYTIVLSVIKVPEDKHISQWHLDIVFHFSSYLVMALLGVSLLSWWALVPVLAIAGGTELLQTRLPWRTGAGRDSRDVNAEIRPASGTPRQPGLEQFGAAGNRQHRHQRPPGHQRQTQQSHHQVRGKMEDHIQMPLADMLVLGHLDYRKHDSIANPEQEDQ